MVQLFRWPIFAHGRSAASYGQNYVVVTRTTAQIAFQPAADLGFAQLAIRFPCHRHSCHNHAWRAEPTLQPMMLPKRLLHGMQVLPVGEPFNRRDFRAVCSGGQHRARLDRLAVHEDDTCTALTCVASDMRPGQAQILAQELHKQLSRLHLGRNIPSVHFQANACHCPSPLLPGRRSVPHFLPGLRRRGSTRLPWKN